MLRTLAENAGFPMPRTLFYTYKTSSNLEAAKTLATFIQEIAPLTRVVIHRDRDFMTDAEVAEMSRRIGESGAIPFITEGCDVESYFTSPQHLAPRLGVAPHDVELWLNELAQVEHNQLQHAFTRKRDEVKSMFYRNRLQDFPDTLGLLGTAIPLPPEKRLGKEMLKRVRAAVRDRFGVSPELVATSPHLMSPRLQEILAQQV